MTYSKSLILQEGALHPSFFPFLKLYNKIFLSNNNKNICLIFFFFLAKEMLLGAGEMA